MRGTSACASGQPDSAKWRAARKLTSRASPTESAFSATLPRVERKNSSIPLIALGIGLLSNAVNPQTGISSPPGSGDVNRAGGRTLAETGFEAAEERRVALDDLALAVGEPELVLAEAAAAFVE
jgi:hypothetical protein